jgi:acyl carrier protein
MAPACLFDENTIRAEVLRILEDITNDLDFDFSGGICDHTRLVADLGWQSVDFAMLIISIEEAFKRKNLPFEPLWTVNGKFIGDVTVGQIVGMLVENLG